MFPTDVVARYIHGSNALDGVTLSLEQTAELVEGFGSISDSTEFTAPGGKTFEAAIVLGHKRVFDAMMDFAKGRGVMSELRILEFHKLLMEELLLSAGEYRECSLKIKGLLIGSPPEGLKDRMPAFINLINNGLAKANNKEQLAWRVHHEFFTLHPFIEANGRMARLLLNYIRIRAGLGLAILGGNDRERYSKAIIEFQRQKIARARARAGH